MRSQGAWCDRGEGRPGWCDWLAPLVDVVVVVAAAAAILPGDHREVAYASGVLLLLAVTGAYENHRLTPAFAFRIPRLVVSAALPSVVLALVDLADPDGVHSLVVVAPVVFGALVLSRLATHVALGRHRPRCHPPEPTIVVGSGDVACRVVEHLRRNPRYGLQPIGVVDGRPCRGAVGPVLGEPDELTDVIDQHGVRRVIVAFGHLREDELVDVIRRCERADVEIYVVPRLFELGLPVATEHLGGIPVVRLSRAALRPSSWRMKRAFDITVTSVALVLVAPVLAVIAALVKASSPGPVLFRQTRIGQRGRSIEMLKFRTMRDSADGDTRWTVDGDPRVTRIGSILRRTSLDELPQLFNVLRGDMSLVGPRPERPYFAEQFRDRVPRYDDRLRVPVGMTGLAQVRGLRGDTSIAERVWFDNRYIETWSIWTDIVILARTVLAVVRPPQPDGATSHDAGSRDAEERALVAMSSPRLATVGQEAAGGDG